MLKHYRPYQTEANDAAYQELLHENRCCIRMFCGTGKSLIMKRYTGAQDLPLLVYVSPSLCLIQQFCKDYFTDVGDPLPFCISSEIGSTTDPALIRAYLTNNTKKNKIICITYQSYDVLLTNLNGATIDMCMYDEAHRCVGEGIQQLIFTGDHCKKQLFFTATPVNNHGIIMVGDNAHCGKTVFAYSYLDGLRDKVLNPFEINIDLYTEDTNKSVYESIARAILQTGNNRVLTFHSDVKAGRDTSVNNFVQEDLFIQTFRQVAQTEFLELVNKYLQICMVKIVAETPKHVRDTIINQLDTTDDTNVYIISSCETIGEGIDTKNANMCVFVDAKSSQVKITQNIGRIVRPQCKPSTILIPCWVDREKYMAVQDDKEKCDEVIRRDMNAGGNFSVILNMLSAVKYGQDEETYNSLVHYPDQYTREETASHVQHYGYEMLEEEGGELMDTLEYLGLELDDDDEEYNYDLDSIAETNNVCIEVHTNSLENPVETYNAEAEQTIRMYRDEDEDGDTVYYPIVNRNKNTETNTTIPPMPPRLKINVHTNPEIKVLWKIVGDITENLRSCVIDCEVEEYDPMEVAIAIVERAKERELGGGELLPRFITKKANRNTPELIQETKDATKLSNWNQALKGSKNGKCDDNVRDYLDENMPRWREEPDEKAMEDAIAIVERRNQRLNVIPRSKTKRNTPELEQEYRDAIKLGCWRQTIKGNENGHKCPDKVRDYLDENMPGWRDDLNKKTMDVAIAIVGRQNQRPNLIPRFIVKKNRKTPELEQEYRDAEKLGRLKQSIKGNSKGKCPDEVRDYLDSNMSGWREEQDFDKKAMEDAMAIVERRTQRPNLIPRFLDKKKCNTSELIQEYKDAAKIGHLKQAIKGKGNRTKCCYEVRNYLDENMPGWRDEQDFDKKAMEDAIAIVGRRNQRPNLMPRHIEMHNRITPELVQEQKDYNRMSKWKLSIKGKGDNNCPDEVRDYLDSNMPGWRDELDFDKKAMEDAIAIVERRNQRPKLIPRFITKKNNRNTPELIQEAKDAIKLGNLKNAIKGIGTSQCPDEVRDYLDHNMPGWREELDEKAMNDAIAIVGRQNQRPNLIPRRITKNNQTTPELIQEAKDAKKIGCWKQATKGSKNSKCCDEVRDYLDKNMPGWRTIEEEIKQPQETLQVQESKPTIPPNKQTKVKQTKLIKTKIKTYDDMSEAERRALIEKHLKKQKDRGYNSTNPEDKEKLNHLFASNVVPGGKVVFLDHTEFKTAYALLEHGVLPEDMIIPQRQENYDQMRSHELFGQCVVLSELNTLLQSYSGPGQIIAIYADYCSTLEKDGIPFIELAQSLLKQGILSDKAVLGITITLRNPEGVRFAGEDILLMESKIWRTFINYQNLMNDIGPYTYGGGAPMATWMFRL